MSPEEIGLLQHAGQVLIVNMSSIVTTSVLYGLYVAIFTFGIRALLKRNPWTKYTWILFSLLSVLFIVSTANLATGLAHAIGLIRSGLINNANQPLTDRFLLADANVERADIAQNWLGVGSGGGFLFVVADAVVVWRACVLWPGSKTAKALLLVLLFSSLASAVVSAALETTSFTESNIYPISSPTGIMIALSQSLSLATNVVATSLIGHKAYCHRQMMRASMGMQNSTSGAILLFLTESGVAFCILQIIAIAINASTNGKSEFSALDFAERTLQEVTGFAATAYPVLVLIIVDSHRSISDHTESGADSGAAHGSNSLGVGSHLSFAAPQAGISSSGQGVGTDSVTGSRIDAAVGSASHPDTVGAVAFRDLEKGEGLTAGETPDGRR